MSSANGESSWNSCNSIQPWNFHVFLSFRGEDTRIGFTDHLYAALQRKGIKTFRDDEELDRGEVISQELLHSIEISLSAIVIFSPNYAFSKWCLNELQKILQCKNELGREVFPVFYGVDPSDVRHQKGSFEEAFRKHQEKFVGEGKVQKWRDALREVANISGWDSRGRHEAELVENIVSAVWTKICSKLPLYFDDLVAIDLKINELESLLGAGLDDVRFIGIWGMGGIGKTTIARVVYEKIQSQFQNSCFIANVREGFEREGLVQLQRKLVSHLTAGSIQINDPYEGKKAIRMLLCSKRVLLVLDDVNSISQLEHLAGNYEWFGSGSRVIITTRDMHTLISYGMFEKYEVKILNKEESLELFCQKAFRGDQPKESYLELSKNVIKYAGGLPLALSVLGSCLCGRSIREWETTLDKIKRFLPHDILKTLRISYEGLDEIERKIFLHVACLLKGMLINRAEQILEICGLYPSIGLKVLHERSLISSHSILEMQHERLCDDILEMGIDLIFEESLNDSHERSLISSHGILEMHDLLQELGRNIVFEESPNDIGKRSRLWSLEEIDQVLTKNQGTEAIEGIALMLSEPYEAHWEPEAFSKMCNLKLLIISSNLHLPRGLKCLSKALKVLEWKEFPLKELPLRIQLDELVDLRMTNSKIQRLWTGKQIFGKLKFINLSDSKDLIQTPNLSGVPNLESLNLEGCTNLVEVHPSLGQLKNLFKVNFRGCKNLTDLPRKLEVNSLKIFILWGSSKLKRLPEFGENMKQLSVLQAGGMAISKLPISIGNLVGLTDLDLRGCTNLISLPSTITSLKSLTKLDVSGCSQFSSLPNNLNKNEALEIIDVSGTAVREINSSIVQLENLKGLSFRRCSGLDSNSCDFILPLNRLLSIKGHQSPSGLKLPPSFSCLFSLTSLDLSYCNIEDGSLPDDFSCFPSLETLDLSGNNFSNIPTGCFSNLERLNWLCLVECSRLRHLPDLPQCIEYVDADNCDSMEPLLDPHRVLNCGPQQQFYPQYCGCGGHRIRNFAPQHPHFPAILRNAAKPQPRPQPQFRTMDPQMLWDIFGSRATQLRCSRGLEGFRVNLTGSEIPSRFDNQNYFFHDNNEAISIIVEIPEFCRVSEWSGCAICLLLDDGCFELAGIQYIEWDSKSPEDEYAGELTYGSEQWRFWMAVKWTYPHLCFLFLHFNDQNCWQHLKDDNKLELLFYSSYTFYSIAEEWMTMPNIIKKCGCHVLCKEDFEMWNRTWSKDMPSNSENPNHLVIQRVSKENLEDRAALEELARADIVASGSKRKSQSLDDDGQCLLTTFNEIKQAGLLIRGNESFDSNRIEADVQVAEHSAGTHNQKSVYHFVIKILSFCAKFPPSFYTETFWWLRSKKYASRIFSNSNGRKFEDSKRQLI